MRRPLDRAVSLNPQPKRSHSRTVVPPDAFRFCRSSFRAIEWSLRQPTRGINTLGTQSQLRSVRR